MNYFGLLWKLPDQKKSGRRGEHRPKPITPQLPPSNQTEHGLNQIGTKSSMLISQSHEWSQPNLVVQSFPSTSQVMSYSIISLIFFTLRTPETVFIFFTDSFIAFFTSVLHFYFHHHHHSCYHFLASLVILIMSGEHLLSFCVIALKLQSTSTLLVSQPHFFSLIADSNLF